MDRNPFPKGTQSSTYQHDIGSPTRLLYCMLNFLAPCIALVFPTKSMMKVDSNIVSMHACMSLLLCVATAHIIISSPLLSYLHHHHITTSSSSIDQHYYDNRHLCLRHCCELLNEMSPTVEVHQMDQHIHLTE